MSTFRTFGTVAIMIACFAVIYPRFMHPIVLKLTGLNDPPANYNAEDKYPPGHKGRMPPRQAHDNVNDNIKKNMRHSPQPGMRHAAEMNSRQQSQGSGRGMMGVVLPMYAVGIVCYLLYTLYKVFNKSKTPNAWDKKRGTQSQYGRPPPAATPQRQSQAQDRMGFPQDFAPHQGEGDVREFLHDKRQRKDLEDLLTRVDDKNVSVDEMRLLQKRLEETEAQMSRILSAMSSVQSGVDTVVEQVKDEDSNETAEKQTEAKEEKEDEEEEEDLEDLEVEKDNDCNKPNKSVKGSESSEETNTKKEKIMDDSETSSQEENSPDNESKDEMIPEQTKDEEEDSSVRKRKVLCAED